MNFRTRLLILLSLTFADRPEFNLDQVYQGTTGLLQLMYPNNNTIEASIRGALQTLRDEGHLNFLGNGRYSFTTDE